MASSGGYTVRVSGMRRGEQVRKANHGFVNHEPERRGWRYILVTGQVDWLTEPLAFINEGEILPCCCRAKGDIEIEI